MFLLPPTQRLGRRLPNNAAENPDPDPLRPQKLSSPLFPSNPMANRQQATFADIQADWIRIVDGAQRTLETCDGDNHRLSRSRTFLSFVKEQILRSIPLHLSPQDSELLLQAIEDLDSQLAGVLERGRADSAVLYTIEPVVQIPSGRNGGRPFLYIHPDFLHLLVNEYAYGLTKIANLLTRNSGINISTKTIRRRLLELGLRSPEEPSRPPPTPLTDAQLDQIVTDLRHQQPNIGLRYLAGALRAEGIRVPRSNLRESVNRVNPFPALFAENRRRYNVRQVYSNAGSNAVWHHDGQHGLISFGIVIHGFVDGHSRLVTGLQANSNNRATTVLALFLSATAEFGIPSRVRGDRGGENVQVAYWMERYRGPGRGSYLWGTSPHNTRIERLWPETTRLITSSWKQFFVELEQDYGYNRDLTRHVWLGIFLFLDDINRDLKLFQRQHNHHPLSSAGEKTPVELFFESMVVNGVRGLWTDQGQIEEDLAYVQGRREELEEIEMAEVNGQVNGHVALETARCPWGADERGWELMYNRMEGRWSEDKYERWELGQEAMLATMEDLDIE